MIHPKTRAWQSSWAAAAARGCRRSPWSAASPPCRWPANTGSSTFPISNCINSEINRIFLLTQFNTASLHRHIQSTYHFDPFGGGFVDILSAEQTEKSMDWYQGTADAVRRNLVHFRTSPHDLVLILSGDQLYRMDFREIIEQHLGDRGRRHRSRRSRCRSRRWRGSGSCASTRPRDPAVRGEAEGSRGHRQPDPELPRSRRGSSSRIAEKRCLASMGIYVFNRAVLAEALDNTMTDFGREVIPSLLGRKRLCAHIFEGYWEDIGTVRSFFEANLALAQPLPPFNFFEPEAPIYTQDRLPAGIEAQPAARSTMSSIGDGSIITDSTLKHCVLGIRTFVGEGSRAGGRGRHGRRLLRDGRTDRCTMSSADGRTSASAGTAASGGRSSTRTRGSATAASCRPRASRTAAISTGRS